MTEATAVSREGRISPADLGIWKDDHVEQLQRITRFIHAQHSVAGIQLAHAGRKASTDVPWKGMGRVPISEGGWIPVAPTSLPFSPASETPDALTEQGIRKVIEDFRLATKRALTAGFKVIEVHAAHGYLINEFMSPLANNRDDKYGGTFENRIRLLLEIVDTVRAVLPDGNPLFVRISATDWIEGGWTIEDSVSLANVLKLRGVDLIDCSSGGLVPNAKIPAAPGYQVPFAEEVRKRTGILTGAVGIIVKSDQAEAIIANKQADIVLMARELLRDPYFPLRAAHELDHEIAWPAQYLRAKRTKK